MHKRLLALILVFGSLLALAGCALPDPVDITEELTVDTSGDTVEITGYPGDEKHVSLPDEINGQPVTIITPAFVEGKTYESVKLPSAIDTYARRGDEFILCADSDEQQIPINEHTAPGIYCRFFNTGSIHINGVNYKSKIHKDLAFSDLKGIRWKYVGTYKDEPIVVYIEFINETFFSLSREGKTISHMFDYELKGNTVVFKIYEGTSFGSEPPSTTYTLEKIGNSLVMWDQDVIFYPTSDEKPKPEPESVWEYEDLGNDQVMITGYNGNAAIVDFPDTLKGKTVLRVSSSIADDYHFTHISGLNTFNFLSFDPATGLYTLDCIGEGIMMNGTLDRFNSLCKFFNTDRLIIYDKQRTYDANLRQETIVDCQWRALGDESNPFGWTIEFFADGRFVYEENGEEEVSSTWAGNYALNGDKIEVTKEDGTKFTFDYMGDSVVCWGGSPAFFGTPFTNASIKFELETITLQMFGWGHTTWRAPQGVEEPAHGNVLEFSVSGSTVTVTTDGKSQCIPAGTYQYKINGRYTTLTSDTGETYVLTAKYLTFVDEFGNEYA